MGYTRNGAKMIGPLPKQGKYTQIYDFRFICMFYPAGDTDVSVFTIYWQTERKLTVELGAGDPLEESKKSQRRWHIER